MPKGVIQAGGGGSMIFPMEVDFPDDPIEAASLALELVDEYSGNMLNYPRVITKAQYDKEEKEIEEEFESD